MKHHCVKRITLAVCQSRDKSRKEKENLDIKSTEGGTESMEGKQRDQRFCVRGSEAFDMSDSTEKDSLKRPGEDEQEPFRKTWDHQRDVLGEICAGKCCFRNFVFSLLKEKKKTLQRCKK